MNDEIEIYNNLKSKPEENKQKKKQQQEGTIIIPQSTVPVKKVDSCC